MNNFKVMMNGIIKENPTFVLLLGMCPTLGTTSSAINGMGMGLATMAVLVCSNIVISCIKNIDCGELLDFGTCRSVCCQEWSDCIYV